VHRGKVCERAHPYGFLWVVEYPTRGDVYVNRLDLSVYCDCPRAQRAIDRRLQYGDANLAVGHVTSREALGAVIARTRLPGALRHVVGLETLR
jgi:hypothetical protein